jgi:CubicO group peptidase (beta-lactamase class C family)
MACPTRTNATVTAPIGARVDVEHAGSWQDAGVNRGDADPERAAPNILDTTPENQAPTFRNQDQVWPVRVIRRGDAVRPLPSHARSLADLTFEVDGVGLSVSDYMAGRRTAGLLILKHGEIALERYGMGNGPESRWTSFSTAKSITATLVGAALHDGAIGSLDDRCEQYLPRLRGSAYEGVTIRNLLRMCSGWPGARKTMQTDAQRSFD